jgi:hypothetical protein
MEGPTPDDKPFAIMVDPVSMDLFRILAAEMAA